MDLNRLRQATAPQHAATEETVPVMSATLTAAEYVDVLRRFYRMVSAWDAWADAHVPDDLRAMLSSRRRASLLEDDLRVMGEVDVPADIPTESMNDSVVHGDARAVFLGRMYVMEGSTLGGQFIAKHVEERLGLQPGRGDSFFRGYGDATGEQWKAFRAVLAALPDEATDTVIASAQNMFELFGVAMAEGRV